MAFLQYNGCLLSRLKVPNCEKSKVPETRAEAALHLYKVVLDMNVHSQNFPFATAQTVGGGVQLVE